MSENQTPETDPVQAAAKRAKKIATDGVMVEQHSLGDQIQAEQHNANRNVLKRRNRGVVFSKLRFPGAC